MYFMEKEKIALLIATTSQDKIEGIKEAFLHYYPEEEFEIKIYSGKTESGVPDQPFGNDTYQGAFNRINDIREKYKERLKEQGIDIDYYIGCEAGIDDTNKVIIDGKVVNLHASEQVVCIYDEKQGIYSFGKSSSWVIPEKDIEEIRSTNLDQYLRARGCKGLQDVGDGEYVSRATAVMESTKSAIASNRFMKRCKMIDEHVEGYEDTSRLDK